jgi:type II secretion system protein G
VRLLRALQIIASPIVGPLPLTQLAAAMGLMASFVVIYAGFFVEMPLSQDRKRQLLCGAELQALVNALAQYRSNCSKYPKELEGLIADEGVPNWNGPYVKELPLDPWGRSFQYLKSPDSDMPEILSYGADGKPGGDLFDRDISSRASWRIIPETPDEKRSRRIVIGLWPLAWVCFAGCIVLLRKMSQRRRSMTKVR